MLMNWVKTVARQDLFALQSRGRLKSSRFFDSRLSALEERILLTATWVPQGPGPILDGQVEGMNSQNNPVAGAIHAVVAHPTDPNIIWAGTVNGGIWKTTNATSSSPTWTPLTDQLESLSTGALVLDPTDTTNNTLIAGIGRNSSNAFDGGALIGLLKTTNGGTSWTKIDGGGVLVGKNISGIVARGNTMVVSVNSADVFTFANVGVFRSTDGGATFTHVSGTSGTGLPSGRTFDLVDDPSNQSVMYASVADAGSASGIYKTIDSGATWTLVSDATMNALIANSTHNNLEMDVGSSNNVYAGIVNDGQLAGLFRSGDGGNTWTQLDTPSTNENGTVVGLQPRTHPGAQGFIHFSIVADPTNANLVYLGGDRQPLSNGPNSGSFPNSIGANNYSGRLFRVDASLAAGSQATALTHNPSTSSNSAPHADSREMVFDASGNIIETDDGGIYRRTNPQTTGDWFSVNGNLQITEFHSVAYDALSNTIFGGAQDVGTPVMVTSGSTTWIEGTQGDGGVVAVDNVTLAGFNQSVRYSSFQRFGEFTRSIWDSTGGFISSSNPTLLVGGSSIYFDFTIQFYTPIILNAIDPSRGLIGTNSIYETLNSFDNLSDLTGDTGSPITAMAYGGFSGGVANPDVIYFASGGNLYFRATSGGSFSQLITYPGSEIRDIVLDPQDWNSIYVLDGSDVYYSDDAGTSWVSLTGNLASLTPTGVADLRTIEFVQIQGVVDGIVVGGAGGTYSTTSVDYGNWIVYGPNLPNAVTKDLHWDSTNDVLLAGIGGRGAWTVPDASTTFDVQVIPVFGDGPGVFRPGESNFYVDANLDQQWSTVAGGDKVFKFGNSTDIPLAGDWDGNGVDQIGIFRQGMFYLDFNGNGTWDRTSGGDKVFSFGTATDIPVVGDWNGDGTTDIGVFRKGTWYLDLSGDGRFGGVASGDGIFTFGIAGDIPVVGDWNGSGKDKFGVFRGGRWYLDLNGNRKWDGPIHGDATPLFGQAGDIPVAGDWNGNGKDKIGVYRAGTFYFDVNGNRAWNNITGGDYYVKFGNFNDKPVIGLWTDPESLGGIGTSVKPTAFASSPVTSGSAQPVASNVGRNSSLQGGSLSEAMAAGTYLGFSLPQSSRDYSGTSSSGNVSTVSSLLSTGFKTWKKVLPLPDESNESNLDLAFSGSIL